MAGWKSTTIHRALHAVDRLGEEELDRAGSQEAAEAWAIFYTLIESARLNRVNPRAYLNWVVEEI